jgi:hypothetical protein
MAYALNRVIDKSIPDFILGKQTPVIKQAPTLADNVFSYKTL